MSSEYDDLLEVFKGHLKALSSQFRDHPDVRKCYRRRINDASSETDKRQALCLSLKEALSPRCFMKDRWFNDVCCYTASGDRLWLEKIIVKGSHVCVMQGRHRGRPVVVKWYQSKSRNVSYETNIYKKMRSLGAKVPWFSGKWSFWGHPVLVMEKLESLGCQDDPVHVAVEVLKQLKILHTFGIHCDIKPGNIMRSRDGKDVYLIDYGGVAIDRLGCGYRRWIWSPKWTCRKAHEKYQVATPYDDFRELAHTVKAMQLWNSADKTIDLEKCDVVTNYKGRLKRYKRKVKAFGEQPPEDAYEQLIDILQG
jgi:hypothetical protein